VLFRELERTRFRRAFADRVQMIQLAEALQDGRRLTVKIWRPKPYFRTKRTWPNPRTGEPGEFRVTTIL
jgi:hypothetical protein